jgi:hypothetical protein
MELNTFLHKIWYLDCQPRDDLCNLIWNWINFCAKMHWSCCFCLHWKCARFSRLLCNASVRIVKQSLVWKEHLCTRSSFCARILQKKRQEKVDFNLENQCSLCIHFVLSCVYSVVKLHVYITLNFLPPKRCLLLHLRGINFPTTLKNWEKKIPTRHVKNVTHISSFLLIFENTRTMLVVKAE